MIARAQINYIRSASDIKEEKQFKIVKNLGIEIRDVKKLTKPEKYYQKHDLSDIISLL